MKAMYNAQTKEGRKKLQEKHELNALIVEKVSEALATRKKKRRAARTETERELNVFNNLEISSKCSTVPTDDDDSSVDSV